VKETTIINVLAGTSHLASKRANFDANATNTFFHIIKSGELIKLGHTTLYIKSFVSTFVVVLGANTLNSFRRAGIPTQRTVTTTVLNRAIYRERGISQDSDETNAGAMPGIHQK
jgi:hypothetical protein